MRSTPLESQKTVRIVQRNAAHAHDLAPRCSAAQQHYIACCYAKQAGDKTQERRVGAPLMGRRLNSHAQAALDDAEDLVAPAPRAHPQREIDALLSRAQRRRLTT